MPNNLFPTPLDPASEGVWGQQQYDWCSDTFEMPTSSLKVWSTEPTTDLRVGLKGYNTTKKVYQQYNGTTWVNLGQTETEIQNQITTAVPTDQEIIDLIIANAPASLTIEEIIQQLGSRLVPEFGDTEIGKFLRVLDTESLTWANPPSGGGSGLPVGGLTGQVLTKLSNADGDVDWATPASSGGGETFVKQTLSGNAVDWSAATYFTKSINANTTLTFSNLVLGKEIILEITNTAPNPILTLPAGIKFLSNTVDTNNGAVNIYTIKCIDTTAPSFLASTATIIATT